MGFNIKIIRSSRKSIALSISAENKITLRCPHNVSESRINAFLESKKDWINKTISQNEAKLSLNKPVLEYREIYVCGERLPLLISDKNRITENRVYIKSFRNIKSVFVSHFWEEFICYANELSEQTGLHANGFFVRAYKRRWGCCDSKGKITFNYMLFMLPFRLQRYVVIHELCHTVYFNHSSKFWKLVAKFEPDYKKLVKQIRSFDYITNLY